MTTMMADDGHGDLVMVMKSFGCGITRAGSTSGPKGCSRGDGAANANEESMGGMREQDECGVVHGSGSKWSKSGSRQRAATTQSKSRPS